MRWQLSKTICVPSFITATNTTILKARLVYIVLKNNKNFEFTLAEFKSKAHEMYL